MDKSGFSVKNFSVKKVAALLNEVACWGIVLVMVLVVFNIILRAVFKSPILGTYEYTSFLTALIVGCGIAYCAAVNGHIAIGFIIEKLGKKAQSIIDMVTGTIVFCCMLFFTWRMFLYAGRLAASNEVSPTTQTPFYLFVYVIAAGFAVLSLVLLDKAKQAIKEVRNP
ncbi:MAG: TRAP transporter small permease [Firmicutes bacterium]|nr:TRAP transporter small permease [Bacillota bacterium]